MTIGVTKFYIHAKTEETIFLKVLFLKFMLLPTYRYKALVDINICVQLNYVSTLY